MFSFARMPVDVKPPDSATASNMAGGDTDRGSARVDVTSLLALPQFGGDGSLRRFLDDYDRYARIQGWNDERKLDVLPLTLSGIARDAFDKSPSDLSTSVRHLAAEPSVIDALNQRVAELEARLAAVTSLSDL